MVMRRTTVSCILFVALSLLPLTTSQAQQPIHILQQALLGNETEDIAFVASGPLAGHIAVMDGYKVRGLPTKHNPAKPLFDVLQLGVEASPRGITYIDSSGLFALDDGVEMTKLFLTDEHGRPRGQRTIQYLNNFLPDYVEGLGYIPKGAKSFPD